MAGGDGSLMNQLMKCKQEGVEISNLVCCALPYGTGNDFARVTGWGGTPSEKFYKSLKTLMTEVCLNSTPQSFDVWDVKVNYH
jgi:diacylglycerol kinase family enzyme